MTEKRFGEFNQKRFITSVELDNTCGIEDLMKNKKYGGFREKDYHKINKIRDELNRLYYENEELKSELTEKRYTVTLGLQKEIKEIIDHCKSDKQISIFEFLKQVNEQDKAFKKLKKENEQMRKVIENGCKMCGYAMLDEQKELGWLE